MSVHPIVAALIQRRQAEGLSQSEVARRMGIQSQSAISEIETAANPDPRLSTLTRYAAVVGMALTLDDEEVL